jgi:dihydrofolate reductase
MGYSTYQWVVDHLDQAGADGDWPYSLPSVVLTHRDLEPIAESIRVATGPPQEHRALLEELAGGKDAWIVGGGDVAAQFADAGMLQEVIVWFAPVLLGSGKPLFTGRQELELQEAGHNGAFLCARYAVTGGDRSNR